MIDALAKYKTHLLKVPESVTLGLPEPAVPALPHSALRRAQIAELAIFEVAPTSTAGAKARCVPVGAARGHEHAHRLAPTTLGLRSSQSTLRVSIMCTNLLLELVESCSSLFHALKYGLRLVEVDQECGVRCMATKPPHG